MKRKVFSYLTLFILCLLATSCSSDDEPGKDPGSESSPKVEIIGGTEASSIVFHQDGGEKSIKFKTSESWTVKVDGMDSSQQWLTVSPTTGSSGESAIILKAAQNEQKEERKCMVSIVTPHAKATIDVKQMQKDALVVAKSSYTVEEKGGEIEIKVGHNVDFDVAIDVDWIKQKGSRSYQTEKLVFLVDKNDGYNSREGKIIFTSRDKKIKQDVTIFQQISQNYVKINESSLEGWDDGFIKDEDIHTFYKQTSSNGLGYLHMISKKTKSKVTFVFSDNYIAGLSLNDNYFSITENADSLIIMGFLEDKVLIDNVNKNQKIPYYISRISGRGGSMNCYDALMTAHDYWNYIATANSLKDKFIDQSWNDFFVVLGGAISSGLIEKVLGGALGQSGALLITAPFDMVLGTIQQSIRNNYEKIYNDSSIEITEIRKGADGNIEVYLQLKNINTIPKYLYRIYESETNEKTRNRVYCSLVGSFNGLPTYHWHDKLFETNEIEIPTDGTVSETHFLFNMHPVGKGKTVKFRPYMKSTRIKNVFGDVDESFIKYGEPKEYTDIDGTILSVNKIYAHASVDTYNTKFVNFSYKVRAKIESVKDIDEWGVYVLDDNESIIKYPSKSNSEISDDIIIDDLSFNYKEFEEINGPSFFAGKQVKLGVYYKMKNSQGVYDYLTTYYGTPQEYQFVYDQKPQAITGTASSVTESSATVECSYADFQFWDGTCGVEYSGDGNTNTIICGLKEDGDYIYDLDGLKDGETYTYRAFISCKGNKIYGDTKQFITKKKDDGPTPGLWIDLGLPSGVKWASHNVGATSPEDYGAYFAWGETSPKAAYNLSNYKYAHVSDNGHCVGEDGKRYQFHLIPDFSGNPQYDAATANWGGGARMPTLAESRELVEHCTSEWTTHNGVNGRLVTGPNGNSIFFPAAGKRYGTSLRNEGEYGIYWSSAPDEDHDYYACSLFFYSDFFDCYCYWNRRHGHSVRPVRN